MIKKFLDTNDSNYLQDRYMYRRLYLFFTLGENGMKEEINDKTSYETLLKQTCLLFGYEESEFLSMIKSMTLHHFLFQKLETSHPFHQSTNMEKHEEDWLATVVCENEHRCYFCQKTQTLYEELMATCQHSEVSD